MAALYRRTSLGEALEETLDDLLQSQKITMAQADKARKQFDSSLMTVMAKELSNRISFKGKCSSYRNVNDVWHVQLTDVMLKVDDEHVPVDKMEIWAYDAKSAGK
eukprot:m.198457 g.198457  ORF g.198457 m.198457 type:complete len:105 (-) comp18371_c1_seq1:112-426(-)